MGSVPGKTNAPAVDRAAAILDILMERSPRALSLSEIHKTLGINKSSAHSILEALARAGLAERNAETAKWTLGFKTLELGRSYSRASSSASGFAKIGADIRAACRESVHYAILREGRVLIVATVEERSHALTIDAVAGDTVPAHRSALGIALLSDSSEADIKAACAEADPAADEDELASAVRECAKARDNGYAFTNREREEGACGVAAPVRDGTGRIRAAIGMALPSQRMDLERRAFLAAALMRGAAALSQEDGSPAPSR